MRRYGEDDERRTQSPGECRRGREPGRLRKQRRRQQNEQARPCIHADDIRARQRIVEHRLDDRPRHRKAGTCHQCGEHARQTNVHQDAFRARIHRSAAYPCDEFAETDRRRPQKKRKHAQDDKQGEQQRPCSSRRRRGFRGAPAIPAVSMCFPRHYETASFP